MSIHLSGNVIITFQTRHFTTLVLTNADSTPTAALVRNGVVDGAVSVAVANVTTGVYSASCTVPSGYAVGDLLAVNVTATVAGTTDTAIVWRGSVDAVMRGTDSAYTGTPPTPEQIADVVDVASALEAYDVAKASELPDEPDNSGIAAIKERTDRLPDVPAAKGDVQVTVTPTPVSGGFGEDDRELLQALMPPVGARNVTITVESSGGDPIPGAVIRTTQAGLTTGIKITDADGKAVLALDDGVHKLTITRTGFVGYTDDNFEVTGDAAPDPIELEAVVIPAPADPELITGVLVTRDGRGRAQGKVTVNFRMTSAPDGTASMYGGSVFRVTSDANGLLPYADMEFARGGKYVGSRDGGPEIAIEVPASGDSFNIPNGVGRAPH